MVSDATRLLAALLLSGCVMDAGDAPAGRSFDPCSTVVFVDGDARPEERASLDEALATWNAEAGLALRRVEPNDVDSPIEEVLAIRFEPTIPALFGVYDDGEGAISINASLSDDRSRRIVLMHELGHAFGLSHVEGEASLMNPGNKSVPLSEADVERLRGIWGVCEVPESTE